MPTKLQKLEVLPAFFPKQQIQKNWINRKNKMETKTSTKQTTASSQLNSKIAKGKRKGESDGWAKSLQDVFSDSANLGGRQQKTSCRPELNGGKLAQLEGKEKKKNNKTNVGGRKKLPTVELKTKKLQMHVTELEYTNIQVLYKASGKKTLSDFMRMMVLDENKSNSIINNVELIKHLDKIGKEINRIGTNINQLAKYTNIQMLSSKVDSRTMIKFNDQMDSYLQERRALTKAYRAMVRIIH